MAWCSARVSLGRPMRSQKLITTGGTMTISSSHMSGETTQARWATWTYPYRTPADAMSRNANTQRRGLSKYAYFSRSSGGRGRYSPRTSSAAAGSAMATVPPGGPGRRRPAGRPDREPARPGHHVIAAGVPHVRGDLGVGGRGVPEVQDHEREVVTLDRGGVGRRSGPGARVAEAV